MSNPAILLAFANDRTANGRYLSELGSEEQALLDVLNGHMDTLAVPQATLPRIQQRFEKHPGRIRIFHFAGHANGKTIHLEPDAEGNTQGYAKGISEFLSLQDSVYLVFLNGCSTLEQLRFFRKAEIPVMIATTSPIRDEVARRFAEDFYRSLCAGKAISEAFDEARTLLRGRHSKGEGLYTRDLGLEHNRPADDPYVLESRLEKHKQVRLSDWKDTPAISAPPPPASLPTHKRLLVNRDAQNNVFQDALSASLKEEQARPCFFVIHGEESEKPDLLTERFYRYSVEQIFRRRSKELDPSRFRHEQISLPKADDFQRKREKARIKDHFLDLDDVTAEQEADEDWDGSLIAGNWSRRLYRVVLVEHALRQDHWHPGIPDFLRWYAESFWNIALPKGLEVIVLFSVYCPERKFLSGKSELERRVPDLPGTLLDRLEPVSRGDVDEWFTKYLRGHNQTSSIFGKARQLPMKTVAEQLQKILESLQT